MNELQAKVREPISGIGNVTIVPGAPVPSHTVPSHTAPTMTIGQAIERYKQERDAVPTPAFRILINSMIDKNIKTEFSNDSYADAITLTDVMFTRASKEIRILTGAKGDGFLKVLCDSFIASLDRIKSNGGTVRVIMLGQGAPCLTELKNQYRNTLEVMQASSSGPVKHFTVCDSKMARIEEVHDPLTDNSPITAVRARVYFNDSAQAKSLEEFFDQIWERLKSMVANSAPETATPNEALHTH